MTSGCVGRKEFGRLQSDYDKLLSSPGFSEIKKLLEDGEKLQYQANCLEKYLKQLQDCTNYNSISIQAAVSALFDFSIKTVYRNHKHCVQLNVPAKRSFGDYQCTSALSIRKEINSDQNPLDIAKSIITALPVNELIQNVDIVPPGFMNIWVQRNFISTEVRKILLHGVTPPFIPNKYSVIIDMSSPNIAKEMHVGHLRSTIIGESISRLLSFLGHKVLKLNHLGDWGTQFGMLITHLKDVYPDCETYPPISDLQEFYKTSKARFDKEEEFNQRAHLAVVKLQQNDPDYVSAWKQICDISRKEFDDIYRRLGIKNLVERGESFYQSRMEEFVEYLKSQKALQEDEGRLILWPPKCEVPLTVVKSDGSFTYDTSDLTALLHRLHEEKADWVLYVVDNGQAVHLNTVFAGAEMLGYYKPDVQRVQHIGFGVVLGEDKKKFKTRSGDTVRLVDLLNEGLERAKNRLLEKERNKELTEAEFERAQKAVAYGCIKYADLSHSRTIDYVFSFDRMLDDKGNTAVYLLYAYTRIRSIIRNAGYSDKSINEIIDTLPLNFDHPMEFTLAKALCRLPDILLKIQNDFLLHSLCDYLYDLSCVFTNFYDTCYCIERNQETGDVQINKERILLCEATARVMKCGFDILGIETVEKM
ncbi:Arginine--tRNA ligase, cytoplasmic [Schistosoma japonicum]|nr:Arginine--tRNA ligase, cytoplasmic [Schistosoma japonicum]